MDVDTKQKMASNSYYLTSSRKLITNETRERKIRDRLHAHKSFIQRLGYLKQLESHRGCVNCLQWSADGEFLASGSDDLDIQIWNPLEGKSVACIHTGHTGNIFSVKFMPFTGSSVLVTGAEDREVRLHDLSTFQTTHVWPCCEGRVKRLAVTPHYPCLCWCASEDGCIRRIDTREKHTCAGDGRCRNVVVDLKQTCGSVMGYTQCKCIDINPSRPEIIAVGALDPYVRLYDNRLMSLTVPGKNSRTDFSCLAHFAPGHLSKHKCLPSGSQLATTYLSFSPCGTELLVNMSGEQVYLYNLYQLYQDKHTKGAVQYSVSEEDETAPKLTQKPSPPPLPSHHPVLGLQTDLYLHDLEMSSTLEESEVPECVLEMRDRGNQFYDKNNQTQAIQEYSSAILICPRWHVLYSNRATVYMKRNWFGDVYEALKDTERALHLCPTHKKSLRRRVKCLKSLGLLNVASAYLAEYEQLHSEDEDNFVASCKTEIDKQLSEGPAKLNTEHRQLSTWEVERQQAAHDYHQRYVGHCNSHTDIKEASFLGEGSEYVAAGSDDGNIFIWEKMTGNLVRVLKGDDSIVNCIQWHPQLSMMATSGIENVIRLWQPRPHSFEDDRVVEDIFKVSKENQKRMRMDPFEVMLMRMGLRMAMSGENQMPPDQDVGGAGIYIERTGSCRQS